MRTFQLLILVVVLTLFVPFVSAADAKISFVVPGKVASDVPFAVQVQVDTSGVNAIDYDLSVGTDKGVGIFGAGLNKNDSFNLVNALSGPQDTGVTYRVRTETNGKTYKSAGPQSLFTLSNVKLLSDGTGSTFVLKDSPQKTMTPAPGEALASVIGQASSAVTVEPSVCGDGIVGYVDANNNGKFDQGEVKEACDTKLEGGQGCSADCTYIDAGYKIKGTKSLVEKTVCDFASTTCGLEQLQPRERLLAKLNAIFNLPQDGSGNCFPYKGHPANDKTSKDYNVQKLKGFCVTAEGVVDQIPPLLDALKEFYSLK